MKRKPMLWEAISCFVVMVIIIGVGKGLLKLDIQPLLILAAFYAAVIGKRLGYSYQDMEKGVTENLTTSLPVIYILICVGIVIGTWIYSGTVPYLIYLGLKLISPELFLVAAFIITAIVSTATGTAWGSVATAGLALIGVAGEMGIPLGMAAGASFPVGYLVIRCLHFPIPPTWHRWCVKWICSNTFVICSGPPFRHLA